MDFKFTSFPIILLCVSFSFAQNVNVVIHGANSIAKTDGNFVCATLDWWPAEQCDYNQCPWGKTGILNLDLSYDSLINAVKAFNPLRIKVGGSLQDNVVYKVGEVKSCPGFFKKEDDLFGFSQGCLSMERWHQLNTFFNPAGVKLTFGLNALFGRNESRTEKGVWIGDWQPQNTRDFVKYTISKGYKVDSYEFGNQLCGSGIGARVDANQYGKDVIVLKNLVKELYADPETRPKVLGPGCFYDEKWLNTFLEVSGRGVVNGVTHHIYNLGPGDDPNLVSKILDPLYLSQVSQTYKGVLNVVNKFRPQSGAWVSESGGAFNSGSKDVSPTFVDEFWYLDQMGMAATYDQKVFCRQALIGGNYGLLRVVAEDKLEVLDSCAVAWCKEGLRGRALVEELQRAEIRGCSVMRIFGFARIVAWSPEVRLDSRSVWVSVVGLPIHLWSHETFANLASLWGKLIRVEVSTMEPQSFERARFFIESDKMDRIEEMVEVKTSEGLVVQVRVQEQESEKDDSVDVPNGVCEGPVTRENPLFWNGEADRGVADEDVGLVHREVSSSEQLRELGFMETQRALPPVPGLQGTMEELVVTNFGEREQSQEVDLGAKSPDSLKPLENLYFELGCTEIVSNQQVVAHQDNSAVEIVLSKGLSRKVRSMNDLVIDTLSVEQRNRLLKAQGKGKRGKTRKDGGRGVSFANESLTDSDFVARQTALLKEAEATVQLGQLVGVETLGREEELIKDITLPRRKEGFGEFIRKQRCDMVFLLESKLGSVSESALLWHRLMGSIVLAITKESDPDLRVYAHCAKKKPGVSVIFINLSKDRSFNITLSNLKSEDDGKPNYEFVGKQNREEYHLTSLFGKMKGGIVCLNDVPMVQPGSRDIPAMDPRLVDASAPRSPGWARVRTGLKLNWLRDWAGPILWVRTGSKTHRLTWFNTPDWFRTGSVQGLVHTGSEGAEATVVGNRQATAREAHALQKWPENAQTTMYNTPNSTKTLITLKSRSETHLTYSNRRENTSERRTSNEARINVRWTIGGLGFVRDDELSATVATVLHTDTGCGRNRKRAVEFLIESLNGSPRRLARRFSKWLVAPSSRGRDGHTDAGGESQGAAVAEIGRRLVRAVGKFSPELSREFSRYRIKNGADGEYLVP
ncbi:hypothetical protein GQ457_01G007440 [Hibiscus cannabinus]